VGPGDDVLVSTFTFVASAAAVTAVGASPVFVDSDEATWNMDPDLLAEELAARARARRLPAAVVLVDLYGQCADYDRILPLCERYGVPVVEDAAEALGATYAGRPAGSFGRFGVFSFNGNKIITSTGGGMLVTDDGRAAEHARHLATQAREPTPYYEHRELGYNYRLSNLLAALGRSQLADLPRRVSRRRAINARYRAALGDLPVAFMPEAPYGTATCWLTCLTIDRSACGMGPDDVRLALEERDIEARRVWKPMHLQPVFAEAEARVDGTAQRLFESGLCLPSGSSLTDGQQDQVIAAFRECFESRGAGHDGLARSARRAGPGGHEPASAGVS
jgi:dTDP-4-amino-4,6-dideoxygalactose transaminase